MRRVTNQPTTSVMSSAGSGQVDETSIAHRLLMNDVRTTVLDAQLKKVLGVLHNPITTQYAGITNTTEAGKAALRSKADEFGSQLADLAENKLYLEQLRPRSSVPAFDGEIA